MKLGIDVHGGDHAPLEILKGALEAKTLISSEIVLYGDEKEIRNTGLDLPFTVRHCKEKILGTDAPVQSIREKKDASMVRGLRDLKEKKIDGFLSAGNTGALLAGGLLVTGRIRGIDRPALATVYPTEKRIGLLLDAGANAECKVQHIVDFAIMSSLYAKTVLEIPEPAVGLVNIGEEPGKGNELVKQAFPLLEAAPIHFIGSLEGRDIPSGIADIILTDGFTGNVILKLSEGLAGSFARQIKEIFLSNLATKCASVLYQKGLKNFKKRMDYTEYGGAPLLGIQGYLVKAHGSSNAKAIKNAILYLEKYASSQMVEKIQEYIKQEE